MPVGIEVYKAIERLEEKEKVKEILLSFRRNLLKNASSEYNKGVMNTFDYV